MKKHILLLNIAIVVPCLILDAIGTYWDESSACLYFKNNEISDKEAFDKICEAVKNEYGITLYVDEATVFEI